MIMPEPLANLFSFLVGILTGIAWWLWRNRDLVKADLEDIGKALEDGRLTLNELADLVVKIIKRHHLEDIVVARLNAD